MTVSKETSVPRPNQFASIPTISTTGVGMRMRVKEVTGTTYTVETTVDLVICNNGSGVTVTLPDSSGSGRSITVKNIGAGPAVVDGYGADTVDGDSSQTLHQWDSITVMDYVAGGWVVI